MGLIVLVIMGLWYLFLYMRESISDDVYKSNSYQEHKDSDLHIYQGLKGSAMYHTKTHKQCYIQGCEKGGRIYRSAEKRDFGRILEIQGDCSQEEINKRV